MTLAAEIHKLDDNFDVQRLARLVVSGPDDIEVLEIEPGGGDVARVLLAEQVADPFGRTLTRADGADFLRALRWARSSDFLWLTPLASVPAEAAADTATELPFETRWNAPATVPYPQPPPELARFRVAEVVSPHPDDYRRSVVLARLVGTPDGTMIVEGGDRSTVEQVKALLATMGHPPFDRLEDQALAPGLVVQAAPFDRPGNFAWRNALLGARREALATGDDEAAARLDLEFLTRLPRIWLSRCPFTGEVLRMAFDGWGFDSPFWDPGAPLRPLDDKLPATFLGLAGAVVDEHHSRSIPAEAIGAGSVPVYPSVLEDDRVRAVLSAAAVNGMRCDLVAYFARPRGSDPPPFREWGTRYARIPADSHWRWIERSAPDPPVAEDLGRLLRSGRLAWIEPFDTGVDLLTEPEGCPWL